MRHVKLSSLKYSTIKLVIFGSVLLYLGVDLLAWHGPVWNVMYGGKTAAPSRSEIVAEVYGEPITRAQLNRHEAEQDALAGRTAPQPARRAAMLMELVRGKLLRIRTRYNDTRLPDCRAAAEAEVERQATRAESPEAFEAWLQSQGYTNRKQYTDKLEARLLGAALLENAIAPYTEVSDEEVERIFNQLQSELPAPESRQVSHIFLETLHKDPEAVRRQAEELLRRLQNGEDFAALARTASQDSHSAPKGGDLGIVENTAERPLPELPLFGEGAIPPGVPTIAQSKWGWHILQAGEIQPARTRTPEECRASIRTAIESVRREQATDAWFKGAVKEGFIKKRIQTHVQ